MPVNKTHTYRFGDKVAIDNVNLLDSELESYFTSAKVKNIIFDLENVYTCDLYGVNFFLQFQRRAEKNKKKLILYRPSSLFKKILKDAELLHLFTILDTLEEDLID